MTDELWCDPRRQFHLAACPYIGQRGDCTCGTVRRTFVRLDGSSFDYTDDADLPGFIATELGR
jgi:hypothetical protein